MAIFTLSEPDKIRGDQLRHEIGIATGLEIDNDAISLIPPVELTIRMSMTAAEIAAVQAVIDAHEPDLLYFPADRERAQAIAAQGNLRQYLSGLRELSPADAAYALLGRSFAVNDGADNPIVMGIVDRGTAAAYITSKGEWNALPATAKQWETDELSALALVLQALIAVIS